MGINKDDLTKLKQWEVDAYVNALGEKKTNARTINHFHEENKEKVITALDNGKATTDHPGVRAFVALDQGLNTEFGNTNGGEKAKMVGKDGKPKTLEEMGKPR